MKTFADIEGDAPALEALMRDIEKRIPSHFFVEEKEEIRQAVLPNLVAGKSELSDLSAIVSGAVNAARKDAAIQRRMVSLDAPAVEDKSRSVGDTLPESALSLVLSPVDRAVQLALRTAREKVEQREDEERHAKELADLIRADISNVSQISSSKRWRKPRCAKCGGMCGKYGFSLSGVQRWRCPDCKKDVPFVRPRLLPGFTIPDIKIQLIVSLLAEGIGLRAVCRVLRANKQSVMKITKTVGALCRSYLEHKVTGIPASDVEVDEVWTYVFKKQFSKTDAEKSNHKIGSAWIYIGLDRETKLVLAHYVGRRTLDDAIEFMRRLRRATVGQLTVYTDGFQPYPTAVYAAFLYDNKLELLPDFLESPAVVVRNNGAEGLLHATEAMDYTRSCTNQVERFNGTMRGGLKRMARRTQSFSKSWSALEDAVALFLVYYMFCKPHAGIGGLTPAVKAGLAEKKLSTREMLVQIQQPQPEANAKPEVTEETLADRLILTA